MRVLILGAGGQVGRSLLGSSPRGFECIGLDRSALDISNESAVRASIGAEHFDWVVNAAAYTGVDAAEVAQQEAAAINGAAVGYIAAAADRARARLLHLSTDFVFDGRSSKAYCPESPTNPLGVYGRTKLAGERAALAVRTNIVVRTSWVYGAIGKNFVLTMLRLMKERDSIRVVRDQIGSPTWASGLARAIWGLISIQAAGGIYHWCDDGIASWYDFAVAIQEEALALGLLTRRVVVTPIRSDEYPTRAVRPPFSVLDSEMTKSLLRLQPVHWRESLKTMLQELRNLK
jgi:dTDP-4-dehydrorhamnose reductase